MKRLVLFVGGVVLTFPVLASESSHSANSMELIFRFANFSIFIVVIFFSARKFIQVYLGGRKESISKQLQAAHEALAAADTKLKEMKDRLSNSEKEVEEIRQRLLQETVREERELIETAKQNVDRLIENSRKIMSFEKEKLLKSIKDEVVTAIMTEALTHLKSKMTSAADEAWIQRQIEKEESHSGGSKRNLTTA